MDENRNGVWVSEKAVLRGTIKKCALECLAAAAFNGNAEGVIKIARYLLDTFGNDDALIHVNKSKENPCTNEAHRGV